MKTLLILLALAIPALPQAIFYSLNVPPSGGSGALTCSTSQFGACPSTTQTTANLTTLGTTDWVVFGGSPYCSGATEQSMSGGSGISALGVVGTFTPASYGGFPVTFSWTNGTRTGSGSQSTGCYYNTGASGDGWTFTCSAGTLTHTCFVYVLCSNSTPYSMNAHLSDSSASDYNLTGTCASGFGAYTPLTFQFVYNSASNGQTLAITWEQTANTGNFLGANAAAYQ